MPVVPFVSAEHLSDTLAVPLPRYAQIVDYQEAAFFGVRQDLPQGQREYACRNIWTRWQRQAITRELMSAQGDFWDHCNYPFVPTYINAERHDYTRTLLLNNCKVIGLGVKVDVMIISGVTIDYTNDPAQIVFATSATNPDEIHVYHPGTDYEVVPSKITIVSGVATVEIPRVRMVALAYDDNPADGWDYTDDTYFETILDVRRIYLDTTYQVEVFGDKGCGCISPSSNVHYWQDAHLRSPDIGWIKLGCPTVSPCDTMPHRLEVSYLCGLPSLSTQAEDAIIRLAHSRMPSEPCGCDFLKGMWERDKAVPDVLDTERENCPWGLGQGAWISYKFASDMVCWRGRAL